MMLKKKKEKKEEVLFLCFLFLQKSESKKVFHPYFVECDNYFEGRSKKLYCSFVCKG